MSLQIGNLSEVQNALTTSAWPKWKEIAIQLQVPWATIETIESKYTDPKDCIREVEVTWLKTGDASWQSLIAALRKPAVRLDTLATDIEKGHCSQDSAFPRNKASTTNHIRSEVVSNFLHATLDFLIDYAGVAPNDIAIAALRRDSDTNGRSTIDNTIKSQRQEPPKKITRSKSVPSVSETRKQAVKKTTAGTKRKRSTGKSKNLPHDKRQKLPKNTESCSSSDTRKNLSRANSKQTHEALLDMLEKLMSHPAATVFLNEVSEAEVPDYKQVIKEPMWLLKIRTILKGLKYRDSKEIFDKIELIFKNCYEYNGPETTYYQDANELEEYYNSLKKDIPISDEQPVNYQNMDESYIYSDALDTSLSSDDSDETCLEDENTIPEIESEDEEPQQSTHAEDEASQLDDSLNNFIEPDEYSSQDPDYDGED